MNLLYLPQKKKNMNNLSLAALWLNIPLTKKGIIYKSKEIDKIENK